MLQRAQPADEREESGLAATRGARKKNKLRRHQPQGNGSENSLLLVAIGKRMDNVLDVKNGVHGLLKDLYRIGFVKLLHRQKCRAC